MDLVYGFAKSTQVTYSMKSDVYILNQILKKGQYMYAYELRFVALDTPSINMIVFAGATYQYNSNMTGELCFIELLTVKRCNNNSFYYSSSNALRVSPSVFAAELVAIVHVVYL